MTRLRNFTLLAMLTLTSPVLLAQAGGGAGGGAGTGSGAGGAGAGSAGAGSAGAPGSGTGQAGSATTGTTGAATQGTPGNAAATAGQSTATNAPQSPVATAAAASPGADPRKPPAAGPGALTLQQVVERARANNPTLLAAAANLRAVRAQETQAAVRANPYLGLSGSNVSLPAEGASNPYAYAVQVSRLFERGHKREFRIDNARATTTQTAAQLDDSARQTVLAVRTAFTKMLIAKASLELSRAQLADFRHEVDINHDRYTAGDISQLDFERLDLQLGSFESDAANAEIALLQASDQLQTLIGVDTPSATFDITGDILPPLVAEQNGLPSRDDLIRRALATRPDLQAATAAVLAAEATSRLAIANGTADPTLEGEYDRSGTYNSAGFNLNIPIRLFDRNQGNKETARLETDFARISVTATRNQVVSDVDQAWVGYTPRQDPLRPIHHPLPRRINRRPQHLALRLRSRRPRPYRLPRRPPRRPHRHLRRPQRLPQHLARHPPALRRQRHRPHPITRHPPARPCLRLRPVVR